MTSFKPHHDVQSRDLATQRAVLAANEAFQAILVGLAEQPDSQAHVNRLISTHLGPHLQHAGDGWSKYIVTQIMCERASVHGLVALQILHECASAVREWKLWQFEYGSMEEWKVGTGYIAKHDAVWEELAAESQTGFDRRYNCRRTVSIVFDTTLESLLDKIPFDESMAASTWARLNTLVLRHSADKQRFVTALKHVMEEKMSRPLGGNLRSYRLSMADLARLDEVLSAVSPAQLVADHSTPPDTQSTGVVVPDQTTKKRSSALLLDRRSKRRVTSHAKDAVSPAASQARRSTRSTDNAHGGPSLVSGEEILPVGLTPPHTAEVTIPTEAPDASISDERTQGVRQRERLLGPRHGPRNTERKALCGCSKTTLRVVQGLPRRNKDIISLSPRDGRLQDVLDLVGSIKDLKAVCHRHARNIVKPFGFRTSERQDVLLACIKAVQEHGTTEQFNQYRATENEKFTELGSSGDVPKLIGNKALLKFVPRMVEMPTFEPADIFTRYSRSDTAWAEFLERGTINIPSLFDYLFKDPTVKNLMDVECDLYLYHARDRKKEDHGTKGWIRHQVFSLFQQLVRQDLSWYVLTVAARDDRNHRLISYPYYIKNTAGVQKGTGFLHMDISAKQVLAGEERLLSLVQGSLSLDDEDDQGCTIVVPGFHRHFREWAQRLEDRGMLSSDNTTGCDKLYTTDDKREFGFPVPVPCKAGELRITRPDIVHGSTKETVNPRRALYTWFTGIREDHVKLDSERSETWLEVAGSHASLIPPLKSPSGASWSYGRCDEALQFEVALDHTSHIGDALLGRKRWDNHQVMSQVSVLFGADRQAGYALVDEARAALVAQVKEKWSVLVEAEKAAYGANSFFECTDVGRDEWNRLRLAVAATA